jgi:ADP-heptose:LPS heptosyltransferase
LDSELPSIIRTAWRAASVWAGERAPRRPPAQPARILIAPHLRLGDAILLTPLLAKARARYPQAEIVLLSAPPLLPLYAVRPYGVTAWPYHCRRADTIGAMMARDGFDLALLPGKNRLSWLARGLRAGWIVAHGEDRPGFVNWPVDDLRPYPDTPMALGEIFASLLDGPEPPPFRPGDWPAPGCAPFPLPGAPYVALHVGASTRLKHWPAPAWRELAAWLTARGLGVVWSGGPGEEGVVREIDPEGRYPSYAGRLDLAQIWHLISQAAGFVSPDTGVAHLARLTGTPAVTLFGPGHPALFGQGVFWRNTPCAELFIPDIPCRDDDRVFTRRRAWIRRCKKTERQCQMKAACMSRISVSSVTAALEGLWRRGGTAAPAPRLTPADG